MSKGRTALDNAIPAVLARVADQLPALLIDTLREQWNGLQKLDQQVGKVERRLRQWMKEDKAVKADAVQLSRGSPRATALRQPHLGDGRLAW